MCLLIQIYQILLGLRKQVKREQGSFTEDSERC